MLEFNGTAIVLAISFVIFVILENLIFYRPLKRVMNERADYIKKNEDSADASYNAAQTLAAQKDEKIAEAQGKSAQILNDTNLKTQEKFDVALREAKQNSNNVINDTQNTLAEEKKQVEQELKNEIGNYASEIISKILKKDVAVVNVNDEVIQKAMRGEL
ncbi:MAG: hypothetical protein K6A44_01485 [bacterium]|nr:hypothetical protein [bacterium]